MHAFSFSPLLVELRATEAAACALPASGVDLNAPPPLPAVGRVRPTKV